MTFVFPERVPFWVIHLAAAFRDRLDNAVADLNLKSPEAIIIKVLDAHGALPLVELSKHLSYTHPSALRHVDELEEKGFIERQPHPKDRRIKLLVPTPEGKKLTEKITQILEEVSSPESVGLSNSEYEQLVSMLKKVYSNIGREFPQFMHFSEHPDCEAHKLLSHQGDKDK